MNSLINSLPALLPVAYAFAEEQEALIRDKGEPLSEYGLLDARRAGVKSPQLVRIMKVAILPKPGNDNAVFVAQQIGLYQAHSPALTFGYSICIREDLWSDRRTLVHELVHVAQYERLGGIRPFLDAFLRECIDPGHPFGRLQQEAVHVSNHICRDVDTKHI
jgi:hypothetical protein